MENPRERLSPGAKDLSLVWPILVIAVITVALWLQLRAVLNMSAWIDHTDAVIAQITGVERRAIELQTGFRGYVLSGRDSFLKPFYDARAELPEALATLRYMVSDNPAQLERLALVEPLIDSYEKYAEKLVARHARGVGVAEEVRRGHGEGLMQAIRSRLDGMVSTERSLRRARIDATRSDTLRMLVLAFGLLVAMSLFAFRALGQRKRYEEVIGFWKKMIEVADWGVAVGVPDSLSLVSWNPALARLFGYTPDEIRSKSILDLIVAEDHERLREAVGVIHEKGHLVFEVRGRRKDGSVFPALIDSTAVKDESGKVRYRMTHVRDISEIKNVQEALARNERLLNQVIEGIPVGIWIMDREGRCVRRNPAVGAIWGGWKETRLETFGEYRAWDYESGQRVSGKDWGGYRALTEGVASAGELVRIERFDGSEKIIINSAFPIKDPSGEVSGAVLVNTDVTEIKVAEAQQRFLTCLGQSLAEALDVRSALSKIAELSVAELADWAFIHVLTDHQPEVVASAHRDPGLEPVARQLLARFKPSPEAKGGVLECLTSGKTMYAACLDEALLARLVVHPESREVIRRLGARSYIIVPIMGRGQILGTLTFYSGSREYTEKDVAFAEEVGRRAGLLVDNKRLYEQTRKAVRAREDTLAVVSHDLKNPITAVELSTRLLLERLLPMCQVEPELKSKLFSVVETVHRSGRQALGLINDLLDAAKIESGNFKVQTQPENARAMLDEALLVLRPLAFDRSITIEALLPDPRLTVECDRRRIIQVISNLVGNAIKFSPPGKRVQITAAQSADLGLVVSVRDEGPGMSETVRSQLFKRFYQPESTKRQGTGLGLSIAKGIVEAHEGRIWVESHEGAGSTFSFVIPKARLAAGVA